MVEELRTLIALNDLKTMTKTSTYLRISQSTVSKRIQFLEDTSGQKIIYPIGRRVELTDFGRHMALRAPAILQNLDDLFLPHPDKDSGMPKIVLGIGESILTSWAARSVAKFERRLPKTKLEVHAFRAQVTIDRIFSGELHLGLSAWTGAKVEGVLFEEISNEPFVLIPSGLKPFRISRSSPLEVVTIEGAAHSWRQIRKKALSLDILPVRRLETFFAAAQLAINGFGHGLVPEGTAAALGVLNKCERRFKGKTLERKIGLYGRKTILARPEAQTLKKIMIDYSKKHRKP